MKNNYFSIIPLGGVEEIGSNMTIVRTKSEDIIIDCGLLFPYEECFDINYVIPNFKHLDPQRIKSIIITHGHEDHIGALRHFIDTFPQATVYVTKFTLNLIQKKLAETKTTFHYKLFNPLDELTFDEVDISPIHVNHSIPETNGLVIRTKNRDWGLLYISDFKIDLHALHEEPIHLNRIKNKLIECEKTAFFIDSTNIISDGKTTSESELTSDLAELLNRDNKRIFITLFASNVHRTNQIAQIALQAGRKIVLMGRSVRAYFEAAFEAGITQLNPNDFLNLDQVSGVEDNILVFVSGCQGDFLSALRRFSFGEDSTFKPGPQDLVVFSSKVIPGNEKKIYRIYNKLSEFGAEVVTAYDSLIHASGHPGKEDIKILLSFFRPNFYFPIHGESYLLRKHFEFIQNNFQEIETHLIYNHHEVEFQNAKVKINRLEKNDPILIHGKGLEIEKTQISQRRKMATMGAVFLSYQKNSNRLEISTVGLPLMAENLLDQLKKKLLVQIQNDLLHREEKYFKDQIKISTRQFFNNFLGYKPVTEFHIL